MSFPDTCCLSRLTLVLLSLLSLLVGCSQVKPDPAVAHKVGRPIFSPDAAFYSHEFPLHIYAPEPNSEIYYTTNGSSPLPGDSNRYSGPINIQTTAVVRAISVTPQGAISKIATQTMIFREAVLQQSAKPKHYPMTWGVFAAVPGVAPADYGMDRDFVRSDDDRKRLLSALESLPSMSLVLDPEHLFGSDDPVNGGIYNHTGSPLGDRNYARGKGWERPASFEFFDEQDKRVFQVDMGLKIHGGHSRRPEKSPKHSFRVSFKKKYGPKTLDFPLFGVERQSHVDSFVLRAGYGNAIYHWLSREREHWQFTRDSWAKDSFAAMGHLSGSGFYVHLYINGMYWGIYNPTERIDEDFAAHYLGGKASDYDVIKDYDEVVSGSDQAWTSLFDDSIDIAQPNIYASLLGQGVNSTRLVEPTNLIDYVLLNFYMGNWDWDKHNWITLRNRTMNKLGFVFIPWDSEQTLRNIDENVVDLRYPHRATDLFHRLMPNRDFRQLFAQRVMLHCSSGGVLSSAEALSRWRRLANTVSPAVLAEYVRWGDYRIDLHPFPDDDIQMLYTVDYWHKENAKVQTEFFPLRTHKLLEQLVDAGFLDSEVKQAIIDGVK